MLACLASALILSQSTPASVLPKETKAQYAARMRWWQNSRFGMFIHWGLYAIPAGKWGKGSNYAEWIREEAHIPVTEYEKFQKQFNPTKFNADQWAAMAKDAGMRYVVITTKHHDGFNLFPSRYTDWSVKNTPFHRDIMRELSTAVRKKGLTMGWYHSIMDWHHPDYLPRRSWEVADRPATGANFDRFVQYLHNEVSQLLTDYGPIGVLWFDGEWEATWNAKYGNELYALCRKLQPNIIVNNRVSVGRGGIEDAGLLAGDYGTPEQTIPATGIPGQNWETCMTMNDHWGFNAQDTHWKSSETLLHNLIDIASKGGNYLLNVGPRADGTFPPEAVARLHDIGQWMHVNGDSIYGTTASVFDKLPWGRSTTKVGRRRTTLYLQVFDWPKDGRLVVPGLGNSPLSANILGTKGKLSVVREGADLVVHVPHRAPNSIATVVALNVAGVPIVYRAPVIVADSNLLVTTAHVTLQSPSSALAIRYTLDGSEPTAKSTLYTQPVTVTQSGKLRAACFSGGRRVSAVVSESFTKVDPAPADSIDSLAPGIARSVYYGNWEKVPDFDGMSPEKETIATDFDAPTNHGKPIEHIGLRYRGYVVVPADGVYNFALRSDDGAKLMIDGAVVIDHDGVHSPSTKTASVALAKGPHRFFLGWFNGEGDSALSLSMAPVGQKPKPLSGASLMHVP